MLKLIVEQHEVRKSILALILTGSTQQLTMPAY